MRITRYDDTASTEPAIPMYRRRLQRLLGQDYDESEADRMPPWKRCQRICGKEW